MTEHFKDLLLTIFCGLLFCFTSSVNAALLMHLPLDSDLNDISGNNNDGAMPGGSANPSYSAAVYNQGLTFDGNNDYITVPSFNPGSTFSVSIWVNHDNIGTLNTFIEHANNGNNRNDFYIGYDNSVSQLTVELEDNNSTEGGACGDPKFCTGISLNSNRWYHIVVTVTPTTLNVYVDTTLAYSVTHSTSVNFGNGSWLMGGDTDGNPVTSAQNDYLDGRIDDVRIYNHELSLAEISNLNGLVGNWNIDDCNIASAGDIQDSSGNNLHATPLNGATTDTGRVCTALSLDGTDDYAEISDNVLLDFTQTFTAMTWIRPDTIPASGLMTILSKDENFEFHINSSGNINWWWNNSSGTGRQFNSTVAVATNTWTHIAIVYEAGSQRILINGIERGTTSYNETLLTNSDPLQFGYDQGAAGREFDGLIDEVKIYNRALATEEILGYVNNPDPTNRACPTCSGGGGCVTFRDEFTTESYSRQDGTANWSSNWIETNDNGNASTGNVEIANGELQLEGDGNSSAIEREANLATYTSATLTFDYHTTGAWEGNDDIEIYLSNDGGSSWTLVDTFTNDQSAASYSRDITSYIAGNTRIRFVEEANDGAELFHFDDVQIEACGTTAPSSLTIILSTVTPETLGGLNFTDGSLANYDPSLNTASLFFDESTFTSGVDEDINAVHVTSDGRIILSVVEDGATLGGITFNDDDLVLYDPSDGTASLYFDGGAHFSNNSEDIDAVYIINSDELILSTQANARLGTLDFENGDLVHYNTSTRVATLLYGETNSPSNFTNNANIDGFHLLSNGNYLISTNATETLTTSPSTSFSDGDIFEYNPSTNTATSYFDEGLFSGGADINAISLAANSTFHHLEFIHDGSAVTCNAETITIKACADSSCSSLVTIPVTADLLPTGWVAGDSKTFTGSEIYSLKHTIAETVTLDTSSITPNPTNANECKDSGGTTISCDLIFANSGFIFNNETDVTNIIPTQLSGKNSNTGYNAKTITLQAVRASDSDASVCLPAFQNQSLNIDFAAECSNPGNCVSGQDFNLTSGAVSGDLTATNNDNSAAGSSSYDTRLVTFDNDGKLNLVFNYPEAGLIELHVRHNILLADGTTPSGNYMSGSKSFVVRPLAFSIDVAGQRAADYIDDGTLNDSTSSNLSYAADASGSAFTRAGVNFIATITAVQWQAADDANNDGIADNGANLTNNTATTNFGNETTAITPSDITVTHSTSSTDTGTFTNPSNDANFSSGVANKTFNWDEVGIIDLTATYNNYLGAGNNIVSTIPSFGRFTPDHFDTLVTHACNTFTYSGQPFIVTVSARNAAGDITFNYRDTFAYGVTLSDANPAATPPGIFANATISTTSFSSDAANNGANFGVGSTQVANNFTYTFNNKETIPEIIELRATDVTDTSISSNGFTEGSTEIRSGRAQIENAYGSELIDMAVPAQVESFTNNGFIINTDDSCSIVTVTLTDIGTDPITIGDGSGATQTCIRDDDAESGTDNCSDASVLPGPALSQFFSPAVAGSFNLNLLEPGANNTGDIGISLTSPSWLQFDWDGDTNHDNDPSGTASFGLYRGDDRIIYQREVF